MIAFDEAQENRIPFTDVYNVGGIDIKYIYLLSTHTHVHTVILFEVWFYFSFLV